MRIVLLTFAFYFSLIISALSQNQCKLDIGTNLSGISDWMTEMPFVDVMHNSRTWSTRNARWVDGGKNEWNTDLMKYIPQDENGYPIELPFYNEALNLEDQQGAFLVWAIVEAWPKGNYTILYDGDGDFEIGGCASLVSRTPGKLIVNINHSPNQVYLELLLKRSAKENHVRNIRFLMPGHEETYTTEPFNPTFLKLLKPFHTIRFMDWGQTNNWGNDASWLSADEQSDTILAPWTKRTSLKNYTWAVNTGVPYEMMCQLCNKLKANMWVCVPHSASNDYIRQMARLIDKELDPNLTIYVEYSNETWNWMFGQTQWLNQFYGDGVSKGWPEGIVSRIQNNFDIWTYEFKDNPSRIVRVVGLFTAWQDVSNRIVRNLKKGTYDALALAGYFGLSEAGDTALDALGAQATVADVAYWVRKTRKENEIEWIKDDYEELSKPLNVPILYYEAGQHITPTPFGEEPTYARALYDIQRDTSLYNLYNEWLSEISNLVPEGSKAVYMNFSFIGQRSAQYGSWGLLETLDQDTSMIPAPKFKAIMEWTSTCNETTNIIHNQSFPLKILYLQNNEYQLQSERNFSEVSIFNSEGRFVSKFISKQTNRMNIQLKNKPSGIYFLSIDGDQTKSFHKILVK